MKILVLGGSGFVGGHVCEKLAGLSHTVTVPTRRPELAKHLLMLPRLDVVQANVHDAQQLQTLVAGHDAVVNLIAVLHGDDARFSAVHVDLVRKLANACRSTGVRRIVHISALGAALNAPSMYLRSKARGEAVLHESVLDVTVLRPSVIFGAEDKFLNLFARLQRFAPLMPLAGGGTKFQPVWVQDVAQAVVHCLANPQTIGQTYEACGPDVFTLKELVQIAGHVSGHGRPVIGLPMVLGRAQAWLMEYAPGEPLMSRDNLDSMKVDSVATSAPGLQALGIKAASLHAIAPTYLQRQQALDTFRKHASRY
jgi:uncharacterized protein YbjT (DUF2867 family)